MCFCPDKNDLSQHMSGNKTVATLVLEEKSIENIRQFKEIFINQFEFAVNTYF